MPKNDGGPAFPFYARDAWSHDPGMSLRDWFAGQVIGTILLGHEVNDDSDYGEQWIATRAYELADAMLKAREV